MKKEKRIRNKKMTKGKKICNKYKEKQASSIRKVWEMKGTKGHLTWGITEYLARRNMVEYIRKPVTVCMCNVNSKNIIPKYLHHYIIIR